MVFCRAVELQGGSNYGELGNCGCFGVNALGILMIVFPLLHRVRKTDGLSVLDGDIKDMFALASKNKLFFYMYHGTLSVQLLLSVAVVIFAGVLFDVDGASAISFYIDQTFRVIGWILCFQNVSGIVTSDSRVLYACLGWGVCQVVTAGMNCVYYGVDSDNKLTSLSLMAYFVTAILYLVLIIRQLLW